MGPVSGYDSQAELYNEYQPNIRELLKALPKLQVDTVLQLFANLPYDYDKVFHRYPKIVQKVYPIYQEPPPKVSWYFILISDNKEFYTVDDDEQDAI